MKYSKIEIFLVYRILLIYDYLNKSWGKNQKYNFAFFIFEFFIKI